MGGIGVLKYLMFALLFALSAGKLSFWLFPNLTEDVGFLESFMPIYDYTYTGESILGRKKKAKDSDDEESDDDEDENDESDDSTSKASSKTGKDFEIVEKNTVDTADE